VGITHEDSAIEGLGVRFVTVCRLLGLQNLWAGL
jgi:hypothetical protein